MLKQPFGQDKELQEKVVQLSNLFGSRLNDLVNSFDKKDIISYCQRTNATSPWLPTTGRNGVAGQFELRKKTVGRNRVVTHSEIE